MSKSVRSLAAGGGLIALASIAGCGSSKDARAGDEASGAASAGTATVAPVPVTANAVVADDATYPTPPVPSASEAARAGDTLCEAGETPLFSCEIGAKRVSVCGSGSGAVYRYGSPGKVELTSRSLTFANRGYSGGWESQITAKNGDYTYTVYDSTVRTAFGDGGNDPAFSSGLVVSRGERTISSKMCKAESSIDAAAEQSLPAGRFAEH
ncbi:hypothetical protein [Sphingomonas faeni]|uniref:hypothetical protein n=1 Tax=Sphingomonas faeni TaxID=185950 RepID=UPI0033568EFE